MSVTKKHKTFFGIILAAIASIFIWKAVENNDATPALTFIKYGVNANIEHIPYSYDYIPFDSAIKNLNLDVIRVPSGRMNLYNWRTDNPRINDLKILYNYTHADLLLGLNMLSLSLDDQLQFLDSLNVLGVPIRLVELGNEFNNLNNIGRTKYPNGTAYGTVCKVWIDSIKTHFPSVIIGVIGENKNYPENKNWNADVLAQCKPDALTLHVYPEPDSFVVNGILDTVKLKQQILSIWDQSGLSLTKLPVWITETNYKNSDKIGVTEISEANKELATFYILKYLSQLPLVRIICVNSLEGKQGIFLIDKKSISLQATGRAFINFKK